MDTDDLTDETYAILADAHRECGLLGAELAVSGASARTEPEFLVAMSDLLREAASASGECWEEYEEMRNARQFRALCRSLAYRVTKRRETFAAG